jgi:hypothetical protein
MTKDSLELGANGPKILKGAADPSAGDGVAAPVGSLYLRTTGGTLWQKTGANATDWTLNGTASPG